MKLNKQWLVIPLMTAMSAAIVGCGDGGSGADQGRLDEQNGNDNVTQGPGVPAEQQATFCNSELSQFQVVPDKILPTNDERNVELNRSVSISFNVNIDPLSIDGESVKLLVAGNPEPVDVSKEVIGTNLKLTPAMDLLPLTSYEVKVAQTVAADCDNSEKTLAGPFDSTFVTASATDPDLGRDVTAPTVEDTAPAAGESLAPTDTSIRIQFDGPMDISSFKIASSDLNNVDFSFKMIAVQANGEPLADATPVQFKSVEFDSEAENAIVFEPAERLNPSEYYKVTLVGKDDVAIGRPTDKPAVRDSAQNELAEPFEFQFRTGSLVVGLNDALIENIPVVNEVVNDVVGPILGALEFGDDSADSLDNLVVLKLPLSQDLIQAFEDQDPAALQALADPNNTSAFDSVLIAVCDPKSVSTGPDCALSVDLGLDATQLATVLASGGLADPTDVPTFFANALTDSNDGLGVEIEVLDDDSLPLPEDVENIVTGVLNTLGEIPVAGELLDQTDAASLLNLGILDGAVIDLDAGETLSLGILDAGFLSGDFLQGGLEGGSGLITSDGTLFDLLSPLDPLLQGLCSVRLLCPADKDADNGTDNGTDNGNNDGESGGEGSPEPGSPIAEFTDAVDGLRQLLNATDLGQSTGSIVPTLEGIVAQLAAMSPAELPTELSSLTSALNSVTEAFPGGGSPELSSALAALLNALEGTPIPLGPLSGLLATLAGVLNGILPGIL